MPHVYTNEFFDYIEKGSRASARALIGLTQPWLNTGSVLDLGCGRGAWISEWQKSGVADVLGVDGDYVDRDNLAVPQENFHAADLTRPVELGRRFDLAQSLEVGEHLPEAASRMLVESLVRHSDRVLFSAAVVGQGGEFHINEKPLSYWQALFAEHGYQAYDCIRPHVREDASVEPWYRYNTVLYVNAAGREGLPQEVLETAVADGRRVPLAGSAAWRLRRGVVSMMPRPMVTRIAQAQAAFLVRRAQRATA
jgi:SAM-dependent methyltransferase